MSLAIVDGGGRHRARPRACQPRGSDICADSFVRPEGKRRAKPHHVPTVGRRDSAGAPRGSGPPDRRDRRAAGRDHSEDAPRPRSRRGAARRRPRPGVRSPCARAPVPRSLLLPRGAQPRRASHARAHGRGPDRRGPQLVHRLPRAPAPRRGREARRRTAPGARDARRPLALRPTGPLLRAGTDPARVPPALRPARDAAGREEAAGARRAEPHHVERTRGGWCPQRSDDRGRRLRRRARSSASRRRTSHLLRSGHRGRGGATSPPARAGRCARPSGGRRRAPGLVGGGGGGSSPGDDLPAQRVLSALGAGRAGARLGTCGS